MEERESLKDVRRKRIRSWMVLLVVFWILGFFVVGMVVNVAQGGALPGSIVIGIISSLLSLIPLYITAAVLVDIFGKDWVGD